MANQDRAYLARLAHDWWLPSVRGCTALVFGVLAFSGDLPTVADAASLFGAFALAEGTLSLLSSARIRGARHPDANWLLEGIVGVAAGLLAFAISGRSLFGLILVAGVWAITVGVLEIHRALAFRRLFHSGAVPFVAGASAFLFSFFSLASPLEGPLAFVLLFGAFALIHGASLIATGIRFRGLAPPPTEPRSLS